VSAGGFARIVGMARSFDPINFDQVLIAGGRLGIDPPDQSLMECAGR